MDGDKPKMSGSGLKMSRNWWEYMGVDGSGWECMCVGGSTI